MQKEALASKSSSMKHDQFLTRNVFISKKAKNSKFVCFLTDTFCKFSSISQKLIHHAQKIIIFNQKFKFILTND